LLICLTNIVLVTVVRRSHPLHLTSDSSRRYHGDGDSSSSDTESWSSPSGPLTSCNPQQQQQQQRDKSISIIKTLRKRFQLKTTNTEPIIKLKFNTSVVKHRPTTSSFKNIKISSSSHEIYNDRALCPMPTRNVLQARSDEAGSSSSNSGSSYSREEGVPDVISPLEDDLYSVTTRPGGGIFLSRTGDGYESCDLLDGNTGGGKPSSLTCQLMKLTKCGWYWGPISREEAEEKLLDQPDGAFLVRDSSADRYLLSLSFRSNGRTLHTRIEHSFGLFSFYSQPEQEGFGSIVELIDNSMHFSQSGVFCYSRPRSPGYPSFPVRLTKPISRFTHVRSLQYLCRFVIREKITVDNIRKLPLPASLKGYLEEGHY
jgi:suppressor of cytokine signaling 7